MGGHSSAAIYEVLGSSRQALHQYKQRQARWFLSLDEAEAQLRFHRKDHGGLGLRKAYHQINPAGIGRDAFIDQMTLRGYALPVKRSQIRTTRSSDTRFPNLIILLIINDINLIWQSDTTYFRIRDRFYYLTFIIDVYSRRIVGYSVSKDLRATANIEALQMALRLRAGQDLTQLIFHSDGATQYRYKPFVELLGHYGISSSMCRQAINNAYAEKINDVIKNEYLAYQQVPDWKQLKKRVKQAVTNYNQIRIHGKLPDKTTPIKFEHYLWEQLTNPRQADRQRPLLFIRDGRLDRSSWQAAASQYLVHPCIWAPKGVNQILPAHVILHQPMKDPQLVLAL